MANKHRNEVNQPPTGQGKKQGPQAGGPNKLKQALGSVTGKFR